MYSLIKIMKIFWWELCNIAEYFRCIMDLVLGVCKLQQNMSKGVSIMYNDDMRTRIVAGALSAVYTFSRESWILQKWRNDLSGFLVCVAGSGGQHLTAHITHAGSSGAFCKQDIWSDCVFQTGISLNSSKALWCGWRFPSALVQRRENAFIWGEKRELWGLHAYSGNKSTACMNLSFFTAWELLRHCGKHNRKSLFLGKKKTNKKHRDAAEHPGASQCMSSGSEPPLGLEKGQQVDTSWNNLKKGLFWKEQLIFLPAIKHHVRTHRDSKRPHHRCDGRGDDGVWGTFCMSRFPLKKEGWDRGTKTLWPPTCAQRHG